MYWCNDLMNLPSVALYTLRAHTYKHVHSSTRTSASACITQGCMQLWSAHGAEELCACVLNDVRAHVTTRVYTQAVDREIDCSWDVHVYRWCARKHRYTYIHHDTTKHTQNITACCMHVPRSPKCWVTMKVHRPHANRCPH
jgi:hypothetical protein